MRADLPCPSLVTHSSDVRFDAKQAGRHDMETCSPRHRQRGPSLLRTVLAGLAVSIALSGCGVFCGGAGGSGGGFAAGCATGVRF
ncbi:hypothetical protein SAMN05216466_109229 [Paraburkholderia phenazinium]|uniref:Uncharacterized protein n=1 Tax=Paraburkholderia phenazinium TaxID=60549 RepID=A0A1G8C144_9BURK|nr:hypothetical protein SAMN05216466_109229 [Paraburkholderia phenazinium]